MAKERRLDSKELNHKTHLTEYLVITLLLLLSTFSAFCQNTKGKYDIGFSKTSDSVQRDNTEDRFRDYQINSSLINDSIKDFIIDVSVDEKKTTLPQKDYEIISTVGGKTLKELKKTGNLIRVIIHKDDQSDKQEKRLKLFFAIKVKKTAKEFDEDSNNIASTSKLEIDVFPVESPLTSYKFLGYLGTNFDLVDGVQAKKLFFATNILIPETKKWGISLGIYGNRTMTKVDTTKNTSFTSRIESIGRDSVGYYRDTAMKISSYASDNLGANFSPLFPMKRLSDGELKFYYAPQFEFIWRRAKIQNTFSNNSTFKVDTVVNRFPANVALPLITPLSYNVSLNVYDVYLGIVGVLIKYETDEISIRVTSSVGFNFNYVPMGALSSDNPAFNLIYQRQKRLFFFGRMWITEPTTGITLGAEVSNFLGSKKINGVKVSNAQPYYNVTLSKAFNLKSLAAFIKPITQR